MYHCCKVITIAIILLSCNKKIAYLSNKKSHCEVLERLFLTSEFRCSRKLLIPDEVLTFLSRKTKDDYFFAEYGQDYNNTDIPVYPNKRIIFNGIQENMDVGFVFYEKGGVSVMRLLLVYVVKNKTINISYFYITGLCEVETVEDLKKHVRSFHPICL